MISSVAGEVTVVGMLSIVPRRWSCARLWPCYRRSSPLAHGAQRAAGGDTERYRRLASKVSEVLRDPGQAVEVRAFDLCPTLTEVARRAFEAYPMLFTVSLRRFAIFTALAWVGFGAVYVVAGLWLSVGSAPARTPSAT